MAAKPEDIGAMRSIRDREKIEKNFLFMGLLLEKLFLININNYRNYLVL